MKMAPPAPDSTEAKQSGGAQPAENQPADPNTPSTTPTKRKIIYTATVDVVVENLDTARAEVEKLLSKYEAYVAKSDVRNDPGTRRVATYTLRVPVDQFRTMMDGLLALGTPERNAVDSQDVTEEFIDVQARLKTLKAEEEVLNKLLKESGSRDDVLKTREQIRLIRSDIERAQARLDYLSKLTALSTINLTLKEIKDYKPPTTPTFTERVSRRFGGSWESLISFIQDLALFAVGTAPWLPILIPLGIGGFWMMRRISRAANTTPRHLAHRMDSSAHFVVPPSPSEAPPPQG